MHTTTPRIGLDVETTLYDRSVCLVQIADETQSWLIDPLSIPDLSALTAPMADARVAKVIHNATFEKGVLGRQGAAHGYKMEGGHSLAAVCDRELGLRIDRGEQMSDWRRRPLSPAQEQYAALDAEILLRVLDALPEPRQTQLF